MAETAPTEETGGARPRRRRAAPATSKAGSPAPPARPAEEAKPAPRRHRAPARRPAAPPPSEPQLEPEPQSEPQPVRAAPHASREEEGGVHELLWRSGLLNVASLARRELGASLVSPIGYVMATVLIIPVSLIGFLNPLLNQSPVSMVIVYRTVLYLMGFFAPIYTMRLLAEERRSGTLELLLTTPVRDWEVVVGKWLGALVYYVGITAFVWVYVLLMAHYTTTQTEVSLLEIHLHVANLEYGAIFAGYLGVLLVGAAFLAVGLFASSLTHNQVVAAVIAVGILVALVYLVGYLAGFLFQPYSDFFDYVSAYNRYQSFLQGQLVLRDAVYFASVTAATLFGTVRVLESRRWQ
jgi:ABC-2 type transport system permease protein